MIDPELVSRKLKLISEYTAALDKIFSASTNEEILADYLKYHTAERLFQLVVDVMIDINVHIIRAKNIIPPDDFESTFITLGKCQVLTDDFALHIAPVVGLRNRVVHRYESLQHNQFVAELRKNLSDFKQFAVYIAKLLK